jgi:hypothetical protein
MITHVVLLIESPKIMNVVLLVKNFVLIRFVEIDVLNVAQPGVKMKKDVVVIYVTSQETKNAAVEMVHLRLFVIKKTLVVEVIVVNQQKTAVMVNVLILLVKNVVVQEDCVLTIKSVAEKNVAMPIRFVYEEYVLKNRTKNDEKITITNR